jgi:hypothetical protein
VAIRNLLQALVNVDLAPQGSFVLGSFGRNFLDGLKRPQPRQHPVAKLDLRFAVAVIFVADLRETWSSVKLWLS